MKNNLTKIFLSLAAVAFVTACASTKEPEAKAISEPVTSKADTRRADDSYNVVRGDHLWGISGKSAIYGNPYQWPLIFKANRDKIKDADLIHPGQVFAINRNASAGDVDAAVHHARTRGAWSIGKVEDSDKKYLAR
ncbi:MAG: LysM peptidoglycan-binding domain-containing protein [Gammaproteobacteria bacterium]|nr:LysM peptidoglycan-binding domain-containing protein [Gammaproteobacteria bacterium]